MSCAQCGAEATEGDVFCGECGAELHAAAEDAPAPLIDDLRDSTATTILCSQCEAALEPSERFCHACGAPVGGPNPVSRPEADAGQKVSAAMSQGGSEVSDRFQRAWGKKAMRAPIIFLGLMALGFLLPLASARGAEDFGEFGGSVTLSDLTTISVVIYLLVALVLLVLLVTHATSPNLGSAPILIVVGVAFVLAVLATIVATIVIGGTAAAGSFLDDVDGAGSISVGLGTILLLIGSVGLFVTSSRLSSSTPD